MSKAEVYLDGSLKQTLNFEPWKVIINVPDGKYHKVDVKAYDDQNNEGSRFVEFGVNQDFSR